MLQPLPHEIVKVSSTLTKTTTNPDGSFAPIHKWLCENAWRYRQILETETMRYYEQAGVRFILDRVPLEDVSDHMLERGF